VVIDVDALAAAEVENWVWAGADVIEPEYTRALISLSPRRLGRRGRLRIQHADKTFRH
jgi:prolyl oligopeptidase PreP (S9A serine peptidase family)